VVLWVPADIVSQRLQLMDSAGGAARGGAVPEAAVRAAASVSSGGSLASEAAIAAASKHGPWIRLRALSSMETPSAVGAAEGGTSSAELASWRHLRAMSLTGLEQTASSSVGGSNATATAAETSGFEVVASIVRREGLLGLWRGTRITMATLAPSSAVWWLTHEQAKKLIALDMRASEDDPAVLTASGSLAAVTSTIASMPLDVVKTRLQCSEQPQTAWQVLRGVLRESGWLGLWSGFLPRLVAAVPRSVCTVLAYEKAVELCRS